VACCLTTKKPTGLYFITFCLNKLLRTSGPVWQEESFDHVLRSQESLEGKVEYIRQNPVRRGLAQNPKDYPWLWIEQFPT